MRTRIVGFLGILALTVSTGASADDTRLVPDSSVTLRIVSRSNEAFVVDVTNPTDDVASFNRVGLYFVPLNPPDDAPQRLGVVEGDGVARIAPHATTRMTLQAYCLDEHRASPEGKTLYALASRRMPTALANALAGAAKTNTQAAVWRVRAQMPTPLIGDARHDESRSSPAHRRVIITD